MNLSDQRSKFVNWTKKQLIGSELRDDKLIGQKPLDRFFTGFLFPIIKTKNSLEIVDDSEENENYEDEVKEVQQVQKDKRYIPPSSAGFSFFITGKDINLRIFYNAVYYNNLPKERNPDGTYKSQVWKRNKLANDGLEIEFTPHRKTQYTIFKDKVKIDALWRKYNTGYIVTVTMSNTQNITIIEDGKKFNIEQNEKTLFEVEFECIIDRGNIDIYPSKNKELLSDEEKEIELRYKDLHIYAVGHGTAANWKLNKQNNMKIWADFMPMVEVPQVTANTGGKDDETLEFKFLQDSISKVVINKLELFVNNYEIWIEKQSQKAKEEDEEDKITAQNILKNLATTKKRMQKGIELLKNDNNSRISFSTMNEAMLMQWLSNDRNKGISKNESEYKWRPFQLAFILMVLESTINDNSNYRETLDLIWFPTGGGKTEAYLGLMGFLFIYRRLKYPASSGGTVSIMRYTLRLLTSQQFIRANKVILALELIRQKNDKFGTEPFSSGLWVGGATSPNSFMQAKKILQEEQYSKLVLSSCPWCNSKFTKENYIAKKDNFYFTCTNKQCDFGKIKNNILPCNVVDEALYINPPSLLIATVDKFARLVWESRAGSFLGQKKNRPPELIIQDELHLISSALGSIVGLYEVGLDTALISRGMRVKYIASTATIKNAKKQVETLFAREMKIFPPPGLRYDDSYFAKTVPLDEKAGRLYIGYLAPLLSRQDCLRPLASTLLSAPIKLFKDAEEYLDSWWTQIVYHGSLKGVGNSRTLYQGGISSHLTKMTLENLKIDIKNTYPNFLQDKNIKSLNDYMKIEDTEIKSIVDKYLPVRDLDIKVLTSNNTAEENAIIFENLAKESHEVDSMDVALATNMISVGLDISRLALMIINGQPLTTAEYIQASSRVGRGEVPGIVFINYYKTQARSLSHYENFRSYHDSFYRFVEPSSLTPFTYQSRTRALHAALIIAIRYGDVGLLRNDSAGEFNKDNEAIRKIIEELKKRSDRAIGGNKESEVNVHSHIDKLVNEWQNEVKYCYDNKIKLVYNSNDRSFNNLICNFDEPNSLSTPWQTLQSMRNVENSALMKLLRGVKLNEE